MTTDCSNIRYCNAISFKVGEILNLDALRNAENVTYVTLRTCDKGILYIDEMYEEIPKSESKDRMIMTKEFALEMLGVK